MSIEKDVLKNKSYRKVISTTEQMQLVFMSLEPGENIPAEIHDGTQFFRIESGSGQINIWDSNAKTIKLKNGSAIIVPAGVRHMVKNTSKTKSLKLYTLYSPPQHAQGEEQKRQVSY